MPKSRILIVEDEILVREDIEDCLEDLGHEVVSVASTGAEALSQIPTARPDLVLMDIRLKGDMDGVETARQIRTNFRLPVIFLTAHADDATLQRAKAADPVGYIVKPFAETTVNAVIQTALHKHERDRCLRESEEWLTTTLGCIGDAILATDSSGRIRFVNRVAEALTGWSAEEAMGKDVDTVFRLRDGGTREPVPCPVATILRDGKSLELAADTILVCRDGSERQIADSASPIKDKAGNVIGAVLVFRDTAERLRAAEALRRMQKMDAVGQLAGGVAHDFNNLLTVILGSADLLLEGLAPDHAEREEVEEVRKAALRAADLTRQLLAFSRQQVLAPQVLDLNEVVANMDKILRRVIGEDIDLRTVPDRDLGAVRADPSQLEQIVMNLAVNARDAMPTGGKLTIATANAELDDAYAGDHRGVQPGSYVMLAVNDNGVGMDAATRSRIFEPFFTTKPVGKGTGLGLATVYGIVKQSGGYIWVYSEPGLGTTFKIYLPRAEGSVAGSVAQGLVPPVSLHGSETILLVEDEEMVRTLVQKVLNANGYSVLVAANGPEAERVGAEHPGPIHLLMTDVVLPGRNGPEVAQRLMIARPGIRVLYLSGYTNDAIVHRGVLEAGVAFLHKPFTRAVLGRKVREVLDSPVR